MENRQYFTEFVIILDGKDNSSQQEAKHAGNFFFEIEVDEKAVIVKHIIDMAKSKIVLASKKEGFLVSKEQIHFRRFNRI